MAKSAYISNKRNNVWKCTWVIIIWNIWSQMNNTIFKNSKHDVLKKFTLAQIKSWS